MTSQADSTAVALDSSTNDETSKSNVVYLSKRDLEEKQHDVELTVRSGYAYELDAPNEATVANSETQSRFKAELGDEQLHGIENRYAYRFMKRTFDIAFSAAIIIVFSWLFLIIAIAVKVDDPKGPVIFKQRRVRPSIIGELAGLTHNRLLSWEYLSTFTNLVNRTVRIGLVMAA